MAHKHLLILVASCCMSAVLQAGSLTPPGPPGPTMKTLTEVEPRTPIHADNLPITIDNPGSYYLAENATLTSTSLDGIVVASSDVTIDLSGFTLTGPGPNGPDFISGIYVQPPTNNVVVRNGTLRNWRGTGIWSHSHHVTIDSISAVNNGQTGIRVSTGTITNCVCSGNHIEGIVMADEGVVTGNVCKLNTNDGISVQSASAIISHNECFGNGFSGIAAFGGQCRILNNHCTNNTGSGIRLGGSASHVEGNTVIGNQFYGILTTFPSPKPLIIGNTASANLISNYGFFDAPAAGPIVDVTAGGTVTSEHPWANFSF